MRRCVFLDRDGVINQDRGYVGRWEDFEFIAGAPEAMKALCDAGHALVIVTNQSGIARGLYTQQDFERLTARMRQALKHHGVDVLAVYHCPHHPDSRIRQWAVACGCRKPAPGMFLRAAAEHDLDLTSAVLIGDQWTDVMAAVAAGVGRRFLLAPTLLLGEPHDELVHGIHVDLADCVRANKAFAVPAGC